jgi:pimeloyl-ACP methyl ester carboxylesterase
VRSGDTQAIGELAGEALAAGCRFVEQMHEGIASRPFGVLGPVAKPVQVVHDGVAKAVYGAVRQPLRLLPRAAGALAATRAREDGAALAATPTGSLALAALNGLHGDQLAARRSTLALRMQIRRDGSEVPVTAKGLAAAFPDSTVRVAVFVHGLFEADESWWQFPLRGDPSQRRTYGERLQDELGFTPVYVRYNSGLRTSENGRRLAAMLEDLVSCWPMPVAELVLIGHSTGGLVVRSACSYAEQDDRRWTDALRHVFCLGSSHLEADVEKAINVLARALGRLPETRPVASLLDARSAGIKDLPQGRCIEADTSHSDDDTFRRDRCQEVPFLPQADYYFITARLAERPVGGIVSGLLDLDLLNHPAVYEQIRTLMSRRPKALPPMAIESAEVLPSAGEGA